MSRDDKVNAKIDGRLYRFSAMTELNSHKKKIPAYIKNINNHMQAKPEMTEDMQTEREPANDMKAKPETAADLQTVNDTASHKEIDWQKRLQEAVIWKEILSEPLSKRRRRKQL